MTEAVLEIDGREIEPLPGETLLAAARRAGVRIPTLCHVEGLAPDGGCRLCLVEVVGASRPLAACHTPAEPGMRVETATSRLVALRRGVLELWRDSLPEGGLAPGGTREFDALLEEHGLAAPEVPARPAAAAPSHPYLRFDAARCITCRRCLHACEEIQGQFVYGIEGRGATSRLMFGNAEEFLETECTACGACIELCPTGALSDCDAEGRGERVVRSTCGYCGVGCGVEIHAEGSRVVRVRGANTSPVNRGHLCAKGRYAHGWQRSSERLTHPLLREGAGFREVSWEEAIDWLARRLWEIRDARGPRALGAFTSSRSTNEAAYLLQKLFRAVLGTNHVDCCARVCHSSTALALREVTGTGAASASYADIERARCIAVVGSNPTEAHPVVGARIKQAALRGASLVVIDPRRIELVDWAAHHLPLRAGTNVALFNAMARLLIEEELHDAAYVRERCDGFEALARHLCEVPVEDAARTCGLEPEALRAAARELGRGPVLFVHGLGLSELTQGTESVMALANLGMLTGSIGRPGAGMLPLRGQNNVQGNADMGGMPDLVTGYQKLDDPEVRARLQREWGACPPESPGLTIPEMFEEARVGEIAALWIQGEDVAQSDPDQTRVIEALEALELLVVQEIFPSETARYAHLVLPAAGALEQDGTFTNAERRIQRVRRAVAPPGEARPDWEVVRDVANALGAGWSYENPGQVMDEVARVAPPLFGGVSYARLEGEGLQWPCPSPEHPGTAIVHSDGFLRGRGRLAILDFAETPEAPGGGYPYLLITGRVLQHYNVGTMTRRTPNLDLAAVDLLEIHPDDAAREGIESGDPVVLESRWGKIRVPVAISPRVTRGSLFLSFHHPETHANRVTSPHRDPYSNCPEYKVTAVRVSHA